MLIHNSETGLSKKVKKTTLAVGLLDQQPNIPIGEEHKQEAGILPLLSTLSV